MLNILGYIAVIFTAISFLMKDIIKLRIFNLIACILFIIYAFLKNDYPVLIINAFVALVNTYYLIKK